MRILLSFFLLLSSFTLALSNESPIENNPHSNPTLLIDLARVYTHHGFTAESAKLLEQARAKASPEQQFEIASMLAHGLLGKQDYMGAAKLLEPAVAALPAGVAHARGLMQIAGFYQQAKALDAAEKALVEAGRQPLGGEDLLAKDIQHQLLQVWASNPEKLAKAAEEARAAHAANPKDVAALERLVDIYSNYLGDANTAIEYLEKLAALRPSPETQFRLSFAYRQTRQYDKAIDLLKNAMPSQPKFQADQSASQIGQILFQAGKKEEAVAWMKQYFEKASPSINDCNLLAGFYQTAQMPEAAEAIMNKAAELSTSPEEKANFKLRIANSALRRNDTVKAQTVVLELEKDYGITAQIMSQVKELRARLQARAPQARPAQPLQTPTLK